MFKLTLYYLRDKPVNKMNIKIVWYKNLNRIILIYNMDHPLSIPKLPKFPSSIQNFLSKLLMHF
jgi:hypothetical protein